MGRDTSSATGGADDGASHTGRVAGHAGRVAVVVERVVPDAVRRSYAVKFVVAVAVVMALMGAVGGANYLTARETIEASSENRLSATASMQAGSFENWATDKRRQTSALSAASEVDDEPSAATGQFLYSSMRRTSDDIRQVHLVDARSGEVLASSVQATRFQNPLTSITAPWADDGTLDEFSRGDATTRFVGPVYSTSRNDTERVVAIASPVVASDDRVLVAVVSVDTWLDRVSQPTEEHSTALVDAETGRVVAGTDGTPESLPADRVDDATAAEIRVRQHDDHVYASTRLGGSGLVLATGQPASEAFALRQAVGVNLLLVLVTGVLSLALVGLILGQQTIPPLESLRERANRMEAGDLTVDLETRRIDEVGRLYGAFDAMRDSLDEQIDVAESARLDAERAREETEAINRHLVEKADQYSRVMRQCADGDYTRRMDPESRNEAMTEIGRAFNEMIAEIEHTTASVSAFATRVAAASEAVTASGEEVRSSGRQVTESIQSIADGADRQHDQLSSVRREADELSATTEEIASLSDEIAELAERTAEVGQDGRRAAEDTVQGMNEIRDDSADAVEAISTLREEIEAIDELVELITDVAEQTNVLALNANIEAARAGEAGEGFAVVAEEVKDLAEHTRVAAADIEDRIDEIQERTDRTAAEVRRTGDRIADNAADVERVIESLEDVAELATETSSGVRDISAATQQQASATTQVAAMVNDAAEISERTMAEAEDVSAAAEEQTSALDAVSDRLDDVSGQAVQLAELLSAFETDVDLEGVATELDVTTDTDVAVPDADSG